MCCNRFRAKRGRISAASSASARLSEKVEAAGTPDWSVSGRRHAPDRGCHEVTGVKKQVQAKKTQRNAESFLLVPGAGIEPARIAPLVFETSASTDSAIRAGGQFWEACPALLVCKDIAIC